MEDKEKALEQLSGRVTESQKNYFNNEIEGSFSEKIASLIESYKVRVKDNQFNVETNKAAIQQALNVIVKNMDIIELNAKNYVQDIRSDIEIRVNALEEDSTELNNVKIENEDLTMDNENLHKEIEDLTSKLEQLEQKLLSDIDAANVKYDKLKTEHEKLDQDYMKSRIQFGDMKDDLTQKNIILSDKYNKLKEDHAEEVNKLKSDYEELKEVLTDKLNQSKEDYTNKIAQLKENHVSEINKLNKEAQEKIFEVSKDYTELKIKTDETISKLDKDLAVANSTIESKNDLIKRLENEIAALEEKNKQQNDWLNNTIGPIARDKALRVQKLEGMLKDNNIEIEEDK